MARIEGASGNTYTYNVYINESKDTSESSKMPANPQDAFKIIGGNVKTVSEAELIFIGDKHTSIMGQIYNSKLIGETIKNGDIILLEGIEKGTIIDSSNSMHTEDLPKEIIFIVIGWDNIELRDKAANGARQMIGIYNLMKLHPNNIPKKLHDEFLNIEMETDKCNLTRNASLIEAIKEFSKITKGKIYIIAGTMHLETLNKEEIAGTSYIMIESLDQTEYTTAEAYFGGKKDKMSPKIRNKVVIVQNSDGQIKYLGADWLVGKIEIGKVVYIDKSVGVKEHIDEFEKEGFLGPLKIIDIDS